MNAAWEMEMKKQIAAVNENGDDVENIEAEDEEVDEEPELTIEHPKLVSRFIRMWPRSIFDKAD